MKNKINICLCGIFALFLGMTSCTDYLDREPDSVIDADDAYKNYNIHFIVETHSEYMVRKLQTLVAKKKLTQDEVSLQYVYDANPEKRPKGEPHGKSIEIREDGILRDSFGPGFFDEADNLAMDLLRY